MKKLRYPPHVQWEVTSECNHNCIHCYNYWRRDNRKRNNAESEEYYLNIAKKIIERKPNTVVITGGEPFLAFKEIVPSINLLLANGIKVSINTNSVIANEEIINYLFKNGIRLFISFPSATPELCDKITNTKGSCNRIIKSLDNLKKNGINFNLNVVVSKINIDDVEHTVNYLKSRYNIKKIYLTRVGKPVNSDESFDKYLLKSEDIANLQNISVKLHNDLQIAVDASCPYTPCSIVTQEAFDLFGHKRMCNAGKTTYSIGFDGAIKACPRDGKSYGNILTDDFEEVWKSMEEWRDNSLLPAECKNCNEKNFCYGGCRVDSYPMTGKMNSLDSIAIPDNIPLSYEIHHAEMERFATTDMFIVNNHINVVPEEFGYRIARNERYVFVTEAVKIFLERNEKFSFEDLQKTFNLKQHEANSAINKFIYCGIIIKLEERR